MGWNQLVGAVQEQIVTAFMSSCPPANTDDLPYGNGYSAHQLVVNLMRI